MVENKPLRPETEFRPEAINGNFKGKDFLSIEQLDRDSLEIVFRYMPQMQDICVNSKLVHILDGIVASVWFDKDSPSTRTLMSTKTGLYQLGGYANEKSPDNSSDKKGEPFNDSILTMQKNCDFIVLRHSTPGATAEAARIAKVPVFNAGDKLIGHPSQATGDLYTIRERHGRLDNLAGVVARDPRNSRSIQSLTDGLCLYKNNKLYSLAEKELQFTEEQLEKYRRKNLEIIPISSPEELPKDYDFFYSNRLQVETWDDSLKPEHDRLNKLLVIDNEFMKRYGCKRMILLHPLPRNGEIKDEVDSDPRSLYMDTQEGNAAYARMAVFALITGRINPNVMEYQI